MRSLRDRLRLTLIPALMLALLVVDFTAASAQANPAPLQRGSRLQNAATATGNGSTLDTSQMAAVTFQTSGITSATITFEGSNDNSNWNSLTCYTLDSATSTSTTTSNNLLRCNVLGIPLVRARISTWASGTITVVAAATSAFGNVRDNVTSAIQNIVTGGLRGQQTTAPTCALNSIANCTVLGSDTFMQGKVLNGLAYNAQNVVITFNTAYAGMPACVAAWGGTVTYGYYMTSVTATTTAVTLLLGPRGGANPANWSPHDSFSVLCGGTQ